MLQLLALYWFLASLSPALSASSGYVVLIDGGSSGSRVHVHSYGFENGVLRVDPSLNLKQKPGLSSYAANPAKAAESLRELELFAQKTVPKELWASTPLLLQATAGLRTLPPEQAEQIMEVVRDELSTWGFQFRRDWARVISGTEEGINGFIAANYLKGVIKPGLRQEDTFGVLEMGGASMQITFCADDVEKLSADQRGALVPVTLAGTTLLVYTYSYLGYGQEKAAELVRASGGDDPCVLVGSAPKAKGNFEQCTEMIQGALFAEKKTECVSLCSFAGNFQPRITGEFFFAIENFFYTPKFFEAHDARNFLDILEVQGKRWCGTPYHQASAAHPGLSKDELNKFCFGSAYAPLLMRALGFSKQDIESAVFVSKSINGSGIDWALGGVITFLTGAQPVALPSVAASSTTPLRLFFLCSMAGAVCMYLKRRTRHKVRT